MTERRLATQRAVATTVTWTIMGLALTAPMNGLRIGKAPSIADIFLAGAAVTVAFEWAVFRSRRTTPAAPAGGAVVGLAMVVIGGVVGTLFASDPLSSARNLLLLGFGVTPVLVIDRWAPDEKLLRRFTWLWMAGATISAVCGLAAAGDASGRAAGLTTHPNHLAMVSVLGIGLALATAVSSTGRSRRIACGMFTVLVPAVVRAGSRAGLIAMVVTIGLVIVRTRSVGVSPRRLALPLLALLLLPTAFFATSRFAPLGEHNAITRALGDVTSAASDRERVPLIESELQVISRRPLTGSGFENVLRAHNVYVEFWAGAGLLGLAGFVVVAASVFRAGSRRRPLGERWVLQVAYLSGYVGYLAAGTVQNFLWDRYLWLHVGVVLWLGKSGTQGSGDPLMSRASPARTSNSPTPG